MEADARDLQVAGQALKRDRNDIVFVHITDVHINGGRHKALELAAPAANAIGSLLHSQAHIILLLSGDIAFSGQQDEYKHASQFVRNLTDALNQWNPISITVLGCPGNHDCNYHIADKAVRGLIVDSVRANPKTAATFADALQDVKVSYRQFQTETFHAGAKLSAIQLRFELTLGGVKICVDALDTAWASTLGERPGHMTLPTDLLIPVAECNLALALAHHPPHWFHPAIRRSVIEWFDSSYDVVFMGHEHASEDVTSLNNKAERIKQGARMIIGDAFAAKEPVPSEGFKCIVWDVEQDQFKGVTFTEHNGQYRESGASDWSARTANELRLSGNIRLTAACREEIENIGVNLKHQYVNRKLQISDLFVFPNLRRVDVKNASFDRFQRDSTAADIFDALRENGIVAIFGPEQAGKTILAKHLYSLLLADGVPPMYLDASRLRSSNKGEITAWINAGDGEQYESDCLGALRQLPPAKRALIVDNLHQFPGGEGSANGALTRLRARFASIIVLTTTDPLFGIVEQQQASDEEGDFWKAVALFELMTLGSRGRADLIRKWIYLGRTETEREANLELEARRAKKFLDALMGKHGFPKFPLYVLLLVQQLESLRDAKTMINTGSHGHLYEALITKCLEDASLSSQISTVHTYLARFARKLADDNVDALDEVAFDSFHTQYIDEVTIKMDRDKLVDELIDIDILARRSSGLCFRYNYNYYFFLARNIWETIAQAETQTLLDRLVEFIHTEWATNVLTFTAHFNLHDVIISRLLKRADETYTDRRSCKLSQRNSLLLRFRTVEDRLQLIDSLSRDHSDEQYGSEEVRECQQDEEAEPSGDPLGLVGATRVVQVLGQVIKSRASLIGVEDKCRIAEACIGVVGRTLEYVYSLVDGAADEFVAIASDVVEKVYKLDREKSIKAANAIFASLVVGLCENLIGKAASALSSSELVDFIGQLEALTSSPDGVRELVLLSARLSAEKDFPERRIQQFVNARKPSNGQLPLAVLRNFVARRMFYNPPDWRTKGRVCNMLDIELRPFQGKPPTSNGGFLAG